MTKGLMRGSEKDWKGGTGGFAFCDSSYFAQVVWRGPLAQRAKQVTLYVTTSQPQDTCLVRGAGRGRSKGDRNEALTPICFLLQQSINPQKNINWH